MNLEICKGCKYKPYLWVYNDKLVGWRQVNIFCGIYNQGFTIVKVNDDDIFQEMTLIFKEIGCLSDEKYETVSKDTITIDLLKNQKFFRDILKKIEIEDGCEFQIEQQISQLNQK